MTGYLPPEERSEITALWWSRPMWPTQLMVFAGLGTMILGQVGLLVQQTSGPGGFTPVVIVFIVVMLVGFSVAVVGLVLRRQALNRMAYRACPKCGQSNLASSKFCRKCGVTLETSVGGGSPPDAPPSSPLG